MSTPQTDDIARGNHVVPTEWAEQLERERDEARQDLEHWKVEWEIVEARLCGWKHPRDNGIIFEHEFIPVLRKELDEAREKYATEATEHMLAVNKLCGERDEARDAMKRAMDAYAKACKAVDDWRSLQRATKK